MKNKKTFKILALIALFLLIIFLWVVVNDARSKKLQQTPVDTGIQNPFGSPSDGGNAPTTSATSNTGSTTSNLSEQQTQIEPPNTTIVEDNPILKKLSTDAVAGFTFTTEERLAPNEPVATDANIVELHDFSGYKTLRFGDTTDEVIAVKTVLNRQTPSPGLTVNADYDTDMKNAVINFQNKNKLSGDGVIGAKTYAKLNEFQGIKTFTPATAKPKTEQVPVVRYLAKSGFVFDRAFRLKENPKRLTADTIPAAAEAFFDDTGNSFVARYLKDGKIQTFIGKLDFPELVAPSSVSETDSQEFATIDGDFLPENILTVGLSRDRKSFFYMNPIPGGVAGITYNFKTKAKKQILETPLSEWIADFGSDGKINLTTKSSGLVEGYSYNLDVKTGNLSKNIGRINGLTTLLSPDAKKILYAKYSSGALSTYVMDISTGKTEMVSPNALPEKCVWTKNSMKIYCSAPMKTGAAILPDDWYKGKISFNDALWVIDVDTMTGDIVYDFTSKSGENIDATDLSLNSTEDYLGFINKKDGALWGFDLNR